MNLILDLQLVTPYIFTHRATPRHTESHCRCVNIVSKRGRL